MRVYTGKYSVRFLESDETQVANDLAAALKVASDHVGNNSYAQPFPGTYLFGPGDGTTSVMVRRESKIEKDTE